MPKVEIVVIGASAGGLEALLAIVERLSPSAPAVLIAMHTSSTGTSHLPAILGRATRLPVSTAKEGDRITPGRLLIAPPDFHMLVTRRGISLTRGPRENGFRPAIDPLFRSAARIYTSRVMGVILSGALDDGSFGMKVIQQHGGVTVVQDPDEAAIPSMPLSVLENITVDHVLNAAGIAHVIERGPAGHRTSEARMAQRKDPEPQDRGTPTEVEDMTATYGLASGLTCPDCGGALWEIADGAPVRYRCHVGHQFSPGALESSQHDAVEAALWTAVRALEEHSDMKQRMADRAREAGLEVVHHGFLAGAQDSHRQAQTIRDLLFDRRAVEPAGPVVAGATSPARRVRSTPPRRPRKSRTRRVS